MPARDVEITVPGIKPREHIVRRSSASGRAKYPFKAMIVGDYFTVHTERDALAVRDAIKSRTKRGTLGPAGARYTVRQREIGEWICRRVA